LHNPYLSYPGWVRGGCSCNWSNRASIHTLHSVFCCLGLSFCNEQQCLRCGVPTPRICWGGGGESHVAHTGHCHDVCPAACTGCTTTWWCVRGCAHRPFSTRLHCTYHLSMVSARESAYWARGRLHLQ
jgi:hypothetical protein